MALGTYDDLKDSIIKWSHRKDILDLIPDFITLAEYEIYNNAQTQLRVRETETVSTAPADSRYIELPPNFEKARSVQIITGNGYCDVKFQAPEQLVRNVATGQPRFFTVVGNEIEFNRTGAFLVGLFSTLFIDSCGAGLVAASAARSRLKD